MAKKTTSPILLSAPVHWLEQVFGQDRFISLTSHELDFHWNCTNDHWLLVYFIVICTQVRLT